MIYYFLTLILSFLVKKISLNYKVNKIANASSSNFSELLLFYGHMLLTYLHYLKYF